jgi:uncharacterized protein DUF4339
LISDEPKASTTMGIKFACQQCGHMLNVKQHLAGKRGICPKCQAKLVIPAHSMFIPSDLESALAESQQAEGSSSIGQQGPGGFLDFSLFEGATSSAPQTAAEPAPRPVSVPAAMPAPPAAPPMPDPIAEAPAMLWYVLPPGASSHYGPAAGDMFREWIVQGRVSADSMVWRQDWPQWQRAGSVLPQLAAPVAPPPPAVPVLRPAKPILTEPNLPGQVAGMANWSEADEAMAPAIPDLSPPKLGWAKFKVDVNVVIIVMVVLILALIWPVWRMIAQ